MNSPLRKWYWIAAAAAVVCLASCAFAQVEVELTGPNPYYYYYDANYKADVSVGPYVGNVGNVTGAQIVCDDYTDEVWVGEQWKASILNFSSLSTSNVGNTMWGATLDATIAGGAGAVVQLYLEAAYLTEQLYTANAQNPGSNGAQVSALQYALWGIFYVASHNSAQDAAFWTNAPSGAYNIYKGLAGLNLSVSQFANLQLVTPLNGQGGACGSGNGCAQEYFMLVPEGGSALLYLLLAGASCLGAIFLRRRNALAVPSDLA